ncbi:unnamed protein product [Chilo suppressalis]|uniref:Uncharacterized protein n=1 Tax=Chilo suppressalis TaxID=168631 RepID=A0ABN8AYQ3_CHISP|nr:unnamed protein product [Chilo suppressalis]
MVDKEVQCEAVAWRLVGLLGSDQGSGLRARTARLATALASYMPDTKEAIDTRRRHLSCLLGSDQGSGLRARTARLGTALASYMPDTKEAIDARRRQLDAAVQATRGLVCARALPDSEQLSPVTCQTRRRLSTPGEGSWMQQCKRPGVWSARAHCQTRNSSRQLHARHEGGYRRQEKAVGCSSASDQGSGLRARTARLATALASYMPDTKEAIDARRRQLDAVVQATRGLVCARALSDSQQLSPVTCQTRRRLSTPGEGSWMQQCKVSYSVLVFKYNNLCKRSLRVWVVCWAATRVLVCARTARLATALASYMSDTKEAIDARRRQLDAVVQADSSGALISLHVAMKNELQRHVEVYKQALHKLEELSPVTLNQDPASSSHQRLLALSHGDVERRLIDNKSLLTIVDKPALRQLPTLVESLAARVESDKAVLACLKRKKSDSAVRPSVRITSPVAGVLMSYSRGCTAVLAQMSEGERESAGGAAPRSPTDSASDGYHSDSDDSPQLSDRCWRGRESTGGATPHCPTDSISDGFPQLSDRSDYRANLLQVWAGGFTSYSRGSTAVLAQMSEEERGGRGGGKHQPPAKAASSTAF